MNIEKETLEDLQFSFITERLSALAFSPEGEEYLLHPIFLSDEKEIEYSRDVIAEFLKLFSLGKPLHIAQVSNIAPYMKALMKHGANLSGEHIWEIKEYIQTALSLQGYCSHPDTDSPLLHSIVQDIPDLTILIKEIASYLNSPGVVKEDHPRIKAKMEKISHAKLIRTKVVSEYLQKAPDTMQSQQPVFRDNRIVLPVKARDKQRYPGLLHASSHSGNTLFIEPYRLMDKNNDVALAEQELNIEIEKIYRELSTSIAQHIEEMELLRQVVGTFDHYYTMAVFAKQHAYTRPQNCKRGLNLMQACHPVLKEKAIPIDLTISSDTGVVVMSGPNAGGKTVTLKTLGFIALMNQIGMYLPVQEGSEIPIFSSVYTDIGDEQSIERELSTFSGHVQRIGRILRKIDDSSLVILDELGSGTDPIEGSALAQSILEYCLDHAGMTLVTSHQATLKNFAYIQNGIINASMEFDEREKAPTYRVILGEPGESHAIDTARRMNIPKSIIQRSNDLLGSDRIEITAFMKSLKKREQEIKKQEIHIEERNKQLKDKVRDIDLYQLRLRQKELIQQKDDTTKLQRFIRESRSRLENLIRELRENELTKERIKRAQAQLKSLEDKKEQSLSYIEKETLENKMRENRNLTIRPAELTVGALVTVKNTGRKGTLLSRTKKGIWLVELDNGMRLSLGSERLIPIRTSHHDSGDTAWNTKVHAYVDEYESLASPCIDVRGYTLSEAIEGIVRHIDKALMADVHELSIIHGKGEGVLQQGIQEELSHMESVKDFYFARPEDGGHGKTYVIL